MLLRFLKVTENSLYPLYQDGDFVLVSRIPILLRGIQPGDVVVFEHPSRGKLIKRVEHLENEGQAVYVLGLAPDSVDSREFGTVPRERVLGKVIWHIAKK